MMLPFTGLLPPRTWENLELKKYSSHLLINASKWVCGSISISTVPIQTLPSSCTLKNGALKSVVFKVGVSFFVSANTVTPVRDAFHSIGGTGYSPSGIFKSGVNAKKCVMAGVYQIANPLVP